MSYVNSVTLIGNVGNEPEIRVTQNGRKLCRLSLATTERYSKGGELQEKTLWHNVTLWEKSAEIAENHIHKGYKVYIEGRLNYSEWVDENQQKRKGTDIVANRVIILTPKAQASRDQGWDQNSSKATNPENWGQDHKDDVVDPQDASAYPF